MTIAVQNVDGKPLAPTTNIKKVRRMLKDGRAVICGHDPFAVRLTYRTETENTQPLELTEDTGYFYVGLSIKSAKHEFVSEERKLLPDEKKHHMAQKRIRNTRRNRKCYRKPRNKRAANSSHTEKDRLAPSLEHKADAMVHMVEHYARYFPITSATLEMGQFDTAVLSAVSAGNPVPEGLDYQHGPAYGFDTLREAVFSRDKHTCQVCKKSAVKDGVILVLHHIGFRKNDRSNRVGNLLTVCTKCHRPSNHKKGGALWDLKQKGNSLPQAAFMNSVKWQIYNRVKAIVPDTHITYGAVTKRERLSRNIEKSHANDAYCIGLFRPTHRTKTRYFKKRRRNDRRLERFYDAKYIDIRDGLVKKASALGCNRTKRNVPRNNELNCRAFRGKKISAGYRSIRKGRHCFQAGDVVLFDGSRMVVKTARFRKDRQNKTYETVELVGRKGEIKAELVQAVRRLGGYLETDYDTFYKKGVAGK